MHSDATTVGAYLDSLPHDRRGAIEQVRATILEHLPAGYEETMNWGMITYQVPLATYPDTYNGQPLTYAALASQKNYMAVYLSAVYAMPEVRESFREGYHARGKRLDMGKSCVRFRKLDDLPLDVLAETIAAVPADAFVAFTKAVGSPRKGRKRTPA
jgi:hypothetical protein